MNEATPIRRRQAVRLNEISDKRMNDQKLQGQYQPYKDAAWGFINHWYPALFSEELPEEGVEGIQICGVPIVFDTVALSTPAAIASFVGASIPSAIRGAGSWGAACRFKARLSNRSFAP